MLALPFCIPTLTPKFQPQPPVFLHFSATNPLFSPSFQHKKHTKAGISISFAPTSASAGCISVRDAGVAPQRSKFRRSVRPSGSTGHCRHTKTDSQLFFCSKDITPPFDSSKYGCFCNKYGHVFPIFKAYINRHVKGFKYLIVSNLFLLY